MIHLTLFLTGGIKKKKNRSQHNKRFASVPSCRHFSHLSFVFLVASHWTECTSDLSHELLEILCLCLSYCCMCTGILDACYDDWLYMGPVDSKSDLHGKCVIH